VRLQGSVERPHDIASFAEEWSTKLDPNSLGETFFVASDEAQKLFDRLESDEQDSAFRFPELVEWFRSTRSHFDRWHRDEADDED
jgi:hypothetical protein